MRSRGGVTRRTVSWPKATNKPLTFSVVVSAWTFLYTCNAREQHNIKLGHTTPQECSECWRCWYIAHICCGQLNYRRAIISQVHVLGQLCVLRRQHEQSHSSFVFQNWMQRAALVVLLTHLCIDYLCDVCVETADRRGLDHYGTMPRSTTTTRRSRHRVNQLWSHIFCVKLLLHIRWVELRFDCVP